MILGGGGANKCTYCTVNCNDCQLHSFYHTPYEASIMSRINSVSGLRVMFLLEVYGLGEAHIDSLSGVNRFITMSLKSHAKLKIVVCPFVLFGLVCRCASLHYIFILSTSMKSVSQ